MPLTDREKLARYAHEAWSRWARTVFEEEPFLSADRRERWDNLIEKPFELLTEGEQEPDYREADRIIALLKGGK